MHPRYLLHLHRHMNPTLIRIKTAGLGRCYAYAYQNETCIICTSSNCTEHNPVESAIVVGNNEPVRGRALTWENVFLDVYPNTGLTPAPSREQGQIARDADGRRKCI
ncbi:hypothetical protein ALC53_08340 [Atta colombica]|uniref:Uncharacterized protein n=1 Tax=Atta colombica TaxID=520822 RepID=A0A195BAQ5_9HYME|nr:hypothetical protein ALC53_08340 [Atta colombica]